MCAHGIDMGRSMPKPRQTARHAAKVSSLNCSVCSNLYDQRQRISKEAAQARDPTGHMSAQEEVESLSFEARFKRLRVQEGLVNPKKGRRKKASGEPALHEDLFQWLSIRRANCYSIQSAKHFILKCLACGQLVEAVRGNTIYFVLQHEASLAHDFHDTGAGQQCQGLCLNLLEGCANAPTAARFIPCFRQWLLAGAPWHLPAIKHHCIFTDDGQVLLRAGPCRQKPGIVQPPSTACAQCVALANRDRFCKAVNTWCFRLDLIALVHASYTGIDRDEALRTIEGAPYLDFADVEIVCETLRQDASRAGS